MPWDLIQPSFMFMVGVALPFSVASRRARGEPFAAQLGHAVRRALILVLLGIFLRSQGRPQTYFTFEDVLTQIGLGYVFLFLLAHARPRTQWVAAGAVLVATWLAFALYPLPPAGFDTALVGVPADWPHHLQGFAAHWDKNTNLANRADQWFLNLFPRESPFVYNRGGYTTLNFVPSLATMIFGLLAGGLLRGAASDRDKLRALVVYGAAGIALGAALHFAGICPLVKRIWTPSWAIFSAGWAALFLAALLLDGRRARLATLDLSPPRRRRELHRDVRHRARRRALHGGGAADASRPGNLPGVRRRVRADPRGRRIAAHLLADAVLDVSPKALHQDLR